MFNGLFKITREFSIPTGRFGKDGEPVMALKVLRTSQIIDFTESDRSVFGSVNATKTLFVHPDDTPPQINAKFADGTAEYTVRAVRICRDVNQILRTYKIALG